MKLEVFTATVFLSLMASSLYTAINVLITSSVRGIETSCNVKLMMVAVLLAKAACKFV